MGRNMAMTNRYRITSEDLIWSHTIKQAVLDKDIEWFKSRGCISVLQSQNILPKRRGFYLDALEHPDFGLKLTSLLKTCRLGGIINI